MRWRPSERNRNDTGGTGDAFHGRVRELALMYLSVHQRQAVRGPARSVTLSVDLDRRTDHHSRRPHAPRPRRTEPAFCAPPNQYFREHRRAGDLPPGGHCRTRETTGSE